MFILIVGEFILRWKNAEKWVTNLFFSIIVPMKNKFKSMHRNIKKKLIP